MSRPLEGRTALITGASQGLGLAIGRAYVEAGASVFLCGRDEGRLTQARDDMASLARRGQQVLAQPADVSRPADVQRLVAAALAAFPRLHILVNNAGVYGPMGSIDDVDWDAWVEAIEINLFAPVLMCRAVLPHFKAHRAGKIIQLSGGGATNPLPRISAYAASKAAVVRFSETLAEEVREDGIDVNAIAPGALNTRLLDEVLEAGPDRTGTKFYEQSLRQKEQGGAPLERGAALAVFLGSAASDGITGKLLSAIWDPWEDLPEHRQDLAGTDVYTLRRIVPSDRGLAWGERLRTGKKT
jgi:NAD(P)-dependent dehydrogenase (short-subunit alcohol dehydrogenase family)